MTSDRAKLQPALPAIGLFAVGLKTWQALSGSTEVLRQTRAQPIALEEFTPVWSPAVQPLSLHQPFRPRLLRQHPCPVPPSPLHRYHLYHSFQLSPSIPPIAQPGRSTDRHSSSSRTTCPLSSSNATAAFLAAPVLRAGQKIGVLSIPLSSTEVNRNRTADGQWRENRKSAGSRPVFALPHSRWTGLAVRRRDR